MKFYPVGFEAPAKPCVEVLFHTTKIGKRDDSTKFNKLCINGLKAVCGLSDEEGFELTFTKKIKPEGSKKKIEVTETQRFLHKDVNQVRYNF